MVTSVPWLYRYIRSHVDLPIRISFVHNASFGDKALSVFEKDMQALKKEDLAKRAAADQSAVTLLITGETYGESYWLIFPDKQMLLWRYNGPSGLLKWKFSDFVTDDCADYGEPAGGCVGALVDPNGNLIITDSR